MNNIFLPLLITSCFLYQCSTQESATQSQKESTSKTYFNNPILAGWYPDPSITGDGNGNFYMVHSTFAFYPGIPIFHSKDLVNWKQIGHVLDRPEQLELEGFGVSRAIFAPDISYNNGKFYVTCTVVDGKGNFVVTSEDPAGPWSNPVWLPEVIGIDPGLFFDDEKSYLVYNSDAPNNEPLYQGHRTIRMVEFDKEGLKVVSDNRILVNGGVDLSKKPIWAEGPRIYKLNGYYYLMTAEGGTAINHSEMIYRTRDINDDFVPYDKNPILTQRDLDTERDNPITSAGHADIVQHPNGDWYGVFLACRDYNNDHYNTGRETFLAPVKWVDKWPVFDLDGKVIKYQYPLPEGVSADTTLFPLNGNFTFKEDFDNGPLAYHWMFLRTVHDPWHTLSDSYLSMQTRPETVSGTSNPSFLGHRQQHLKCAASVALEFASDSENEQAGLIAFQNETHYYFLNRTVEAGKATVQLLKGNEGAEEVLASATVEAPKAPLYLRIEADVDQYHFYYASVENDWQPLAQNIDGKYLSTKVAGGFVGVTLGMYTTSNGVESTSQAKFDWFEYSGYDDVFE